MASESDSKNSKNDMIWNKTEKAEGSTAHHNNSIVSIDWSSLSGLIASLSISGVFKLWKFCTVDSENLFMHENSSLAARFKEAQRHLGINPNDSIDTRDLQLIFEQKFDNNAVKVKITKDSKFIIVLANSIIHIVRGIYSEGAQTQKNMDTQQFKMFHDIKQFYIDPKHDEKLYILRKNSEMYVADDISDINNVSNLSKIRLLIKSTSNETNGDTDTIQYKNDEFTEFKINKRPQDDLSDDNKSESEAMAVAVSSGNITNAAIDPIGNILAYATDQKEMHLVDIDGVISPQILNLNEVDIQVCSMTWTEDGTYLITGDTFGGIRFWKRTTSSMPKLNIAIGEIVPRHLSNSGSYHEDTPANLFSSEGMWNAINAPEGQWTPAWAVFDFDRKVEIHKFAFQCHGDKTHDVNEFRIEYCDYPDPDQEDKWIAVGSFNGKAGSSELQTFDMSSKKTARYWRWYIKNRHSKWQGWVWNAKFYGCFEDATGRDARVLHECFTNNSRHYSDVTFIQSNGKLVLSGSTDRTANVWCVGTKENPEHPRFCSKIILGAVINCGILNGRNMKVWNPGSNSILLAGEFGTIFCFSITDILLNQKVLLLKNQDLKAALAAPQPPIIPQIGNKQLSATESAQMQALRNWIDIWLNNQFVLESITTIIRPIFLYLQKDKSRYISMLDSFVKSTDFGRLKGILSNLAPLGKGPLRTQPTNDLLELYQISKDAHSYLQNFALDIVNKPDIHATYAGNPGLKKHLRCVQKTVLKGFKHLGEDVLKEFAEQKCLDYSNLCDMGRGGICCRNVSHMVKALRCIETAAKEKRIEILRIKNRFIEARNEGTGYRDVQFNVRFTIPNKVPVLKIVQDSGHEGNNSSAAVLTGTLYNFWCAAKQKDYEYVVLDFGQIVECVRFDFAHYAEKTAAVKTFIIETTDDVSGPSSSSSWQPVTDAVFTADTESRDWQSFEFKPTASRYWRWKILSTLFNKTAVVWNIKFVYSLKSIMNWSLFSGVIVELQLHDENFFQIRKEAMGHKNYTASRFLIDFIDTAVDKLTVKSHNTARDDIILMVQKLLRGQSDVDGH